MAKPGKDEPYQDQAKKDLEAREADLKRREEELSRNMAVLRGMKRSAGLEAVDVASGLPLSINEIGKGKGVELVTENDVVAVAQEAFLNEPVKINVHADSAQGALDVVVVTVNGINQPIIRGRDQVIKRKYVAALARSRVTNYEQQVPDPRQPENIQMLPKVTLTYPFTVREDKNPRGAAWLDALLRQP